MGEYRSVLVKILPGSQPELEGRAGEYRHSVPPAQGVAQGVARSFVREEWCGGPNGPSSVRQHSAPAVTSETGQWRYSADTWHGPSLHR